MIGYYISAKNSLAQYILIGKDVWCKVIKVKPRCKTVLFVCSHHLGGKDHLNLWHGHILLLQYKRKHSLYLLTTNDHHNIVLTAKRVHCNKTCRNNFWNDVPFSVGLRLHRYMHLLKLMVPLKFIYFNVCEFYLIKEMCKRVKLDPSFHHIQKSTQNGLKSWM